MRFTLDQIRKFARQKRDTKFDIANKWNCLVCQLLESKGLKNPEYIAPGCYQHSDGYAKVPQCYDIGRQDAKLPSRQFSGQQLERYIRRLQEGQKAKEAAKRMRTR